MQFWIPWKGRADAAGQLSSMFHSPKIRQKRQPSILIPIESKVLGKRRLESERARVGRLQDRLALWDGWAGWQRDVLPLNRATVLCEPFSRMGGELSSLERGTLNR